MINASTDTVRAVTKVFQLAAILDDRAAQPDKARIAAWSEQVERHKLTEPDLLDGLQAYYDNPSDHSIQIGDLIHHARRIRRDRNEREAETLRSQRAALTDIKAADDMKQLAAGAVMGPTKNRTQRLAAAENALQCCTNRAQAEAAIREYFAAKTAARKGSAA